MNIILLGGAGFIGSNLAVALSKDKKNKVTVVDVNKEYFNAYSESVFDGITFIESALDYDTNFETLIKGQDIVYHLISSTVPATSNRMIPKELQANVILSSNLFEACVNQKVKKVVFISSGGTVYGKEAECPLDEDTPTYPITSYGVQKITIEKLLYLYNYMYGLDYRIIRLANPYGPYQRPNGILGAVTTFTYKALKNEVINVYGDGSVVRDFIYIDDAVRGIIKIVDGTDRYHTFNLGCGYGTSISSLLDSVSKALSIELKVDYQESRKVDVPANYLDIKRYEAAYGSLNPISLEDGIRLTAEFMRKHLL